MKHPARTMSGAALSLAILFFSLPSARAGSAKWSLNPGTTDWETAANWTPATVPDGPADVATFGVSNTTTISLASATEVSGMVFESGTSLYTFAIGTTGLTYLDITGAGITNSPGITQTFIAQRNAAGAQGFLTFRGNATAGSGTVFIIQGGVENNLNFAGTEFVDQASAGNGIYTCQGAINHGVGGFVGFYNSATAATGIFTVEGGASARSGGGTMYFADSATAGDASITLNGTDSTAASPGSVQFASGSSATAGNASLVAKSGSVAGGLIRFVGTNTSGGTANIEVYGNGMLDVSDLAHPAITIGSLFGDGMVLLGANTLTIGSRATSTTFSGVIQGTGAIVKIGTPYLTLGGASTYTGGTTVNAGGLFAANTTGSATGPGPVAVNGGALGGGGIISGPVTIGTGSGAGAVLAPIYGSSTQQTLTLQDNLTLQADATYAYSFKATGKKTRTDLVIANGVNINGAAISFTGITQGRVKRGTVLTLLRNTSANPINGTFVSLADAAVVTISGNHYQASYSGGDGNDLILTVVP